MVYPPVDYYGNGLFPHKEKRPSPNQTRGIIKTLSRTLLFENTIEEAIYILSILLPEAVANDGCG